MGLEALSRGASHRDVRRERPRRVPDDRPERREAARDRCHRPPARRVPGARRRPPQLRPGSLRPAVRLRPGSRGSPRYLARALAPDGLLVYETTSRREPALDGLAHPHLAHVRLALALRCSSIDHRDLPRHVRPGDPRPRRRHPPRGGDLRPRRRRRGPRAARTRSRRSRSTSASTSSARRSPTSPNVEVDVFAELVVDFARRWEAKAIVKGLRVISDFEWEFQMNQLNRHLAPEIETVYVMASPHLLASSPRAA